MELLARDASVNDCLILRSVVSGSVTLITKAMKTQAVTNKVLGDAISEIDRRRAIANLSIALLRDAADIDDEGDAEISAAESLDEMPCCSALSS